MIEFNVVDHGEFDPVVLRQAISLGLTRQYENIGFTLLEDETTEIGDDFTVTLVSQEVRDTACAGGAA
ncbi:hypothetical protein KEX41_28215 (plasmid) [Burkholderia thailandensis]|uniref:hypothetical protein n=1 Tax=Burkholderia thailandensis TaxID=57975 RepID=UPI00192D7F36|nr:hypothetical protein [Burkholderia thailandensis]MBS2132075.1 hypothetical protein [Burkholderia thailandensis]QRA15189.1 hypothetical protein JMY07_30250 [Burkholderia thailandensis]